MTDVSLDELRGFLGREGIVVLDVRSPAEHAGETVAPCDPRPGRIPGSLLLPLDELLGLATEQIEAQLGQREGATVIAYCHSGQRSALAVEILRSHGFAARNYVGSWHEWSRDSSLPAELG